MTDKLGYGSLALGILLMAAPFFYAAAEATLGVPPRGVTPEVRAAKDATGIIVSGGLVAVGGGVAALVIERRRKRRPEGESRASISPAR